MYTKLIILSCASEKQRISNFNKDKTSVMNAYAWFAVSLVFLGCCSNVVFLELLIK